MSDTDDPIVLRQRLAQIDDEIRSLPADDFARKYELSTEADRLRESLANEMTEDLEAVGREWAERAGRKGSHSLDTHQVKGAIVSPIESGGGGI